jgi:uncharacterized protein (DUF362 family)/uncharacterized OB-fold protein
MFYQCPKCKKVWQYPIEKCLDCFLNLERMKSEKIKVIGFSKVNIPTIFHPKVPYFVLVLENEKGNQWVQKNLKEPKIGQVFELKANRDKNGVAIWRIKYDILEAIEKVIELLGGIDLGENSKILILPTLIAPTHPYFAENTSPQFLESTIKYLIEKGVKSENIKVAGQSFDEIPIEASAQKSQLLRVCQDYKIFPLDLAKTDFVKKTKDKFNFEISKEVFNSDLILNLPILKMGRISASENILKFLKKENYLGLKYLFSEEEIIENLNKILPNYLTLADGQMIQKSNKFTAFLGLILASFNPLNLDRVFAEITMMKDLPEFLKKVKIENIPIVGREVEELQFEVDKY